MKKFTILFVLLVFQLSAYAQQMTCLDKLLPYNRFSGVHFIAREEWHDGKDVLDAEGAKHALAYLINSKLLCKSNEVVIKIQPECQTIIADLPQSQTCFLFTNVGHFTISKDTARNVGLIFSKDRSFSEATPE